MDLELIHEMASGLHPEEWLRRNIEAAARVRTDVPPMPPEDVQRITNSLAGTVTMQQAAEWYREFRNILDRHDGHLRLGGRLLDVGCGWGRMLRLLLRDFEPAELAGVDVDERLTAACQATLPGLPVALVEPTEPLPFEKGSFDVVISNSLFSHLPPSQHLTTLDEMVRVVGPGGLLISTIVSRSHLELQVEGDGPLGPPWASLGDGVEALSRFDDGEFLFGRTRDLAGADYGIAVIPDEWIMTQWGARVDVLKIDHSWPRMSIVIARKNG